MLTEIVERTIVGPGGKIEFESEELVDGSIVELRIRPAPDPDEMDTTEYLMSNKANRERLLASIREAEEHPETMIRFESVEELEEYFFSKDGL